MNKSGMLAASIAAASTAVLATASNTTAAPKSDKMISVKKAGPVAEKEKRFEPRFDGLRFIETLVTAHR